MQAQYRSFVRPKDDFLKECMSEMGNVPLDVFNRELCLKCANRECVRAGMNNSLFDKRVRDWRDKLFLNVERVEPGDPRFSEIEAKHFMPLGGSSSWEVRGPEPVTEPEPVVEPEPEPEPEEVSVESEPDLEEIPEPEPERIEEPEPAEAIPVPPVPTNTQFDQGAMLGGQAPSDEDAVIQPGGTYTFGDD